MNESTIFKVLADYNRLRMVVLLLDRELCMTHILIGLGLKQANTSRNLKVLKEAGIVELRQNKNNRYYRINEQCLNEYADIFTYLRKLKENENFIEDTNRMLAVEKCGCKGVCECKLI
ncbi:metalloregulator ArsR/SmtB family transcription factor [Erysipelotrichaceae bacterium OttesenSCG-928-M19]|nr:metalloregulator ArsR/SmtB family transcription factor [Erysipelotrichaceae bacterium OttesenSCG-928-M19]